jgi:proteasome lid subunit RPN8/RPN11
VLNVSQAVVDRIFEHARADAPIIACGFVLGPIDLDRPERVVPMRNAADSPTYWEFDSLEQLRVYREMTERGEEPVIVYRSYAGEAQPSKLDAAYAGDGLHQVVVSIQGDVFRSFRIADGEIREEEVQIGKLSRRLLRARNRRRLGL